MYLLARRCKNHITLLTERLSLKSNLVYKHFAPLGRSHGLCCFDLECTNEKLPSSLPNRTLTNP